MSERIRLIAILVSTFIPFLIGYQWAVENAQVLFGAFICILYGIFVGRWIIKFGKALSEADNGQ